MKIAPTHIDHLVVVAADLAQGVAWCEAALGVTPGPGGEHPLMGTHNRLLRIATADYPDAYLEIIAIRPMTNSQRPNGARRWFDMDSADLQARVATSGPQLIHFVASTPDIRASVAALRHLGIDRGPILAASRDTPRGLLRWQITVREDGQRLFNGGLPTLIEWGEVHPANGMSDSGVALLSLVMHHPQAPELALAYSSLQLRGVTVEPGAPNLVATLQTPRGLVKLESKEI